MPRKWQKVALNLSRSMKRSQCFDWLRKSWSFLGSSPKSRWEKFKFRNLKNIWRQENQGFWRVHKLCNTIIWVFKPPLLQNLYGFPYNRNKAQTPLLCYVIYGPHLKAKHLYDSKIFDTHCIIITVEICGVCNATGVQRLEESFIRQNTTGFR